MNLVFLFLTRSDLDAIPRIRTWAREQQGEHNVVAFVNPHLAIDPSPEQVSLETSIAGAMNGSLITDSVRMTLEMTLQQRWMQIPREVMLTQLNMIFSPAGLSTTTGLVVLSESFQADRISELLTKLRPAWPKNMPMGEFVLIFPNQIPVPKPTNLGRPAGKVTDPEKLAKLRAGMAAARAAKKKKPAEVVAA